MSQVLVDSSVWVEMFRQADSPAVQTLGELMRRGLVCTNGLILAEILSGAKSKAEYKRLQDYFSALEMLADPPELWSQVADVRYHLARRGIQASVADLIVAVSSNYHHKTLFTLDRVFDRIRSVLPFELMHPAKPFA